MAAGSILGSVDPSLTCYTDGFSDSSSTDKGVRDEFLKRLRRRLKVSLQLPVYSANSISTMA